MWLAGGFLKFIKLDSIFFENVELLIPPEFVECFLRGLHSMEYLNYVVAYIVDKFYAMMKCAVNCLRKLIRVVDDCMQIDMLFNMLGILGFPGIPLKPFVSFISEKRLDLCLANVGIKSANSCSVYHSRHY